MAKRQRAVVALAMVSGACMAGTQAIESAALALWVLGFVFILTALALATANRPRRTRAGTRHHG